MNPSRPHVQTEWLGRLAYHDAWALQKTTVADIANADRAAVAGRLLLLEHPPTYTFGRKGQRANLLFDEARLEQEGIETLWVDRGGDVTYHGPGQLVGYPILDLKAMQQRPRPDLHLYLRQLEEVIIQALATVGVAGWRFPGYTGVWVDHPRFGREEPLKIAAIGIKVSGSGISSHGFALNVDPMLHHFAGIVPCGISDHGVTSLGELTGRPWTVEEILPTVLSAFARVFDVTTSAAPATTRLAEPVLVP